MPPDGAPECERLRRDGAEAAGAPSDGPRPRSLLLATKIRWILDHARPKGRIAFRTIDSWLLEPDGRPGPRHGHHERVADVLFDIDRREWSDDLLRLFGVPREILPVVRPSSGEFGRTDRRAVGARSRSRGSPGDQQAALFGQGCVRPGSLKNTYGTGCFLVLNTGARRVNSKHGLITTLACGPGGEAVYALEGSVFIAGAAVQWLEEALGIARGNEVTVSSTGGVYFVPAFTGLGAPYWDPDVSGVICGLTRGSGRAEIERAALESIAYQSPDVVEAMEKDSGAKIRELRVDGGAVVNEFLMQFQADLLGARIVRPENIETTSLGAARLAGLAVGIEVDPPVVGRVFTTKMSDERRSQLYAGWKRAVARAR
jgi:glycerol kinase